jgi:hypothetical protein
MAVPVDAENNSQFQWHAARKLFGLHHADRRGVNQTWLHMSREEKETWRLLALLGIYCGWSSL